jgi:hypothetical protein
MVRQAARLDPAPWEDALDLVATRAAGEEWLLLLGSAALAVRDEDVEPRDAALAADDETVVRRGHELRPSRARRPS